MQDRQQQQQTKCEPNLWCTVQPGRSL